MLEEKDEKDVIVSNETRKGTTENTLAQSNDL